jgi:hypothetical protein
MFQRLLYYEDLGLLFFFADFDIALFQSLWYYVADRLIVLLRMFHRCRYIRFLGSWDRRCCPVARVFLIEVVDRWHVGVPFLALFSNIADFGNSLDELSLSIFVEGNGAIATLLGWHRAAARTFKPLL